MKFFLLAGVLFFSAVIKAQENSVLFIQPSPYKINKGISYPWNRITKLVNRRPAIKRFEPADIFEIPFAVK